MYDIIGIGDITTDVFMDLDEATVVCDLDRDACKLCINYADKIPVKSVTEIHGVGNSANVAVGATRLGLNAALYSHVGDDPAGALIETHVKDAGIDSAYIQKDTGKRTNYSSVINYKAERTIFVYHEPREYALPKLADAKWVYYSSVAGDHEALNAEVIAYVEKTGAKMAYNPGSHQLRAGTKQMQPVLKATHIVFVNKHEAQTIVGTQDDFPELIARLHEMGPQNVVITDGPNGAYASDGEQFVHAPIVPAPVIERTGAGDSFACGVVCALFHGLSLEDGLRWGTMNSASVIQFIGAQEGLLTKEKMEKMIEEHGKYEIQVMS